MKAKELRELNIEEIKKLIEEKKAKVAEVRFDIVSKQIKGHRVHRTAKRLIARALTVLKEKEVTK
jgi:ribosomal protein L29